MFTYIISSGYYTTYANDGIELDNLIKHLIADGWNIGLLNITIKIKE